MRVPICLSKSNTFKDYLPALLVAIIMMFSDFLGSFKNLLLLTTLLVLFGRKRIAFYVHYSDLYWLTYLLVIVLDGMLFNIDKLLVIKRGIGLLSLIAVKVAIESNQCNWKSHLFVLLKYMGVIHSIAVIIETLNPIFVRQIRDFFGVVSMNADRVGFVSLVYRQGLTSQAGIAGFCIALCVCICLIELIKPVNKRKWIIVIELIVALVALLLTGKRTFFAATIVCMLVISYLYFGMLLHKSTKVFYFLFAATIVSLFLSNFSFLSANIDRLFYTGLSGRERLYEALIQNFIDSPVIGVGTEAFSTEFDIGTHNDYLGVLSSFGILGFLPLIFALLSPLVFCIIPIFKQKKGIIQMIYTDSSETVFLLLTSIYWQLLTLMYAMTGNPLSNRQQFFSYMVIVGLGIHATRKIKAYVLKEKNTYVNTAFSTMLKA